MTGDFDAGIWTPVTKLVPPVLGPEIILDADQMKRIRDVIERHRVTTVVAQGGSGKSTLVAGAVAGIDRPVVWIRWSGRDDHPLGVVELIALALQRASGARAGVASSLLASNMSLGYEQLAGVLVNDIASFGPLVIVFDDFHTVVDPESIAVVSLLIDLAPPDVRFVITARTTPEVPLARFHASGQLARLGANDLKVEGELASQVLLHHRIELPPDRVADLVAQTNGWLVGLLMAARAESDGRAIGASHGVMADYFTQELLANEKPDVREFLRAISILEVLDPAVCDAVTTRSDARQVLDDLRERFGFLVIESGGTLRYHDLLRDYLREDLERTATVKHIQELHRRAASATSDELRIDHLLAAHEFAEAGDAIEERSRAWVRHPSSDRQVFDWITRLPSDVRRDHPWLDVITGVAGELGDLHEHVPLVLEALERAYADDQELRWLAARMLMVATMDIERWQPEVARATSPEFAQTHPALRVELAMAAAWADHWRAKPDSAFQRASEAIRVVETSKNATAAESLALHLATPLAGAPGAVKRFARYHSWARNEFGQRSRLVDLSARAHLEMLDALQHGPGDADSLNIPDLDLIDKIPFLALNFTWLKVARFHFAGDDAGIEAALAPLVMSSPTPNVLPFTGLLSATYRRMGRSDEVQSVLEVLLATPPMMQSSPAGTTLLAQVRADLAWANGDLDQAVSQLRPLVNDAGSLCTAPIPDAGCQLAAILDESGEEQGAYTRLAERISVLAGDHESPYLVLQALPHGTTLIQRLAKRFHSPALEAVLRIVGEQPVRPQSHAIPGSGEVLTAREFEILGLLAQGCTNSQIAEKLYLSANTVKTHVSRVLSKLGVSSRSAAVARAREHQMI